MFNLLKTDTNDFRPGNSFPLGVIPPATKVHAVELLPGRGAQLARSAGTSAELVAVENGYAQIRLGSAKPAWSTPSVAPPSARFPTPTTASVRSARPAATAGSASAPRVRGVAMNPVDHPNGGGQGKSKGGGGRQHLVSPWGQLAKGFPTRKRTKLSSNFILVRANGRKPRGQK
ncbi:MAG: hypothetical protein WDM96_02115 [Lacunisphaera sp.]